MIAGFDDIPAASWPSIGLTTIRQDAPKMVASAFILLGGMIEGAAGTQGSLRVIDAQLVERTSTKRA